MHTTKPFAHQLYPQTNKQLYPLQLASYLTTQLILQTHQHGINYGLTQCCSHYSLPLTRQPLSAMPSSYKSPEHTQPTPTCHTNSALLCTPQLPHIKLANHVCHAQLQQSCSHPQYNPLSIHNMHYTPSTVHSTAFHAQDNPSMHISNKHKP